MDETDDDAGGPTSLPLLLFRFRVGQVVQHKTRPGRFVVLNRVANIGHGDRTALAYKVRTLGGDIVEMGEAEVEAADARSAGILERLRQARSEGNVAADEARPRRMPEALHKDKDDPRQRCSPQPMDGYAEPHRFQGRGGEGRHEAGSSVPGPVQTETIVKMVADHARERLAEGIRLGEELVIRVSLVELRAA